MKHRATPEFWEMYAKLPANIQQLADKNFQLLKADPRHPSLHFNPSAECGRRVWALIIGRWALILTAEFCGFGLTHTRNTIK